MTGKTSVFLQWQKVIGVVFIFLFNTVLFPHHIAENLYIISLQGEKKSVGENVS